MENKKIRFAVVGIGHIGRKHATIIKEHPDSELVALVDIQNEAKNHELIPSNIPFFNTLEELKTAGITADVINICTPNGLHAEYALKALEMGCHVVIEKPMALSKEDCEKVIFKSLQVSKNAFVVKQNRYSPPTKWLKEMVGNRTIGDIHMVQINCYWNRDDRYYKKGGWKGTLAQDGGTLFTQFSHFVDIMYWVFGDVKNIQSKFSNFSHKQNTEFEDSGFVSFEFVNGGIGAINFSTAVWDTNMESSITVVGSKGSLKIGGQYMNEIEYCHIEGYAKPDLPPTNPPNDYGPFKGSAANHHYIIQNVIDTLNGRDTMSTNAMEGLKVVDIIERIYANRDLKALLT